MVEHQEDIADEATTTVVHERVEEHYVSASDTLKGAQRATEEEHWMSLRDGIRKYPKAVFWSILFSSALIMEGFDHAFSPWWLVRKGRIAETGVVLKRLRSKDDTEDQIADTVAMMEHTIKIENEMKASSTYWDLFKGVDLRRSEIAVFAWLIQQLCAPLISYIVYFLEQAGLPSTASFDFGMGEYALAIVGVFIAWYLVPMVGRRTLLLYGTAFMTVTTFVIGLMGIPSITTHPNIGYGIGTILLIEYFVFFITIGPIIYTIVTELPSNYLRNKTVGLARAVYNVAVLVYGQLVPRMMHTVAWNWGAKSGFFYGGFMGLGLIWAYFRLPETKNRTFAEMDILFKNKVKARDFKSSKVNIATETISQQ
ncbi:Maltose permease MAL61 [Penicillium maclennaniae]|uniref:Maltose permease MAL61 n=1 Tax=Penicillium maclennaniae TaxID=1343394 RepID=UPI002540D9CF|nr:Maltose permease MAL61 [Penicillium maclennaniae]KAJ5678075.1 Maltose permease MAL61 [Penicillium maclennaniae]